MLRKIMRYFSVILNLILLLLFMVFAAENQELVTLKLYFGVTWTAPLILIIFLCLVLGLMIGFLVGVRQKTHLKKNLATTASDNQPPREGTPPQVQ